MARSLVESADHKVITSSPTTRPGWVFTLLLSLLVALLIVALAGGLLYWWLILQPRLEAQDDVNAEVARIQAAGEPITTADMAAFHRVPEGTFDATLLWLDAIELSLQAKGPPAQDLPYVGTGKVELLDPQVPGSLLTAAEVYLASHEDAVAAARQAAAVHGECRYPMDFTLGFGAAPDINQVRQLARLLSLRSRVAAIRGNSDRAIESVELLFALAKSLEHEPAMLPQLVRLAVLGLADGQTEFLIAKLNLEDDQLLQLQEGLAPAPLQKSMQLSLLGERAMGYYSLLQLSPGTSHTRTANRSVPLAHAIECRDYLILMEEMLTAAELPPPEAWLRAETLGRNFGANVGKPLQPSRGGVLAQSLPAVQQLFAATARAQVERDCLIAGIAFRRFELAQGRPPATLAELVPDLLPSVPADPFNRGGQAKLVVNGQMFAIYSVGQNGIDDRALLTDPETQVDTGLAAPLQSQFSSR